MSGPWRAVAAAMALSAAAVLTWPLQVLAAELSPGAPAPAWSLQDQHDRPAVPGPATRWIVFSAEKRVSDMVAAVLTEAGPAALAPLQLYAVADISAMPSLVTRLVALPRLRELPFALALVRDSAQQAQLADLPRRPGQATVLRLHEGRVAQVHSVADAVALRALLGLPAVPVLPAPTGRP